MKKIIAVDVDDVVANLVHEWLRLYNLEYGDILNEQDIKTWSIGSYTQIGDGMYEYLNIPELYESVSPVDGSHAGVDALKKLDFRIVFVTASNTKQSGKKYDWLYRYGFLHSRSDYIEAVDKSLILCDYMIDDNPENIINCYGQGIVFTREWNKTLCGYPRVNNWREVVEYFSNLPMEMIGV